MTQGSVDTPVDQGYNEIDRFAPLRIRKIEKKITDMSDNKPDTYRIGELSKRADKTVRTIHFYEELGLLQPAERSPGGFRMYTDKALDRIHCCLLYTSDAADV